MSETWETTTEVAARTGYHVTHVQALARNQLLRTKRLPTGVWLISAESVDAWLRRPEARGPYPKPYGNTRSADR